jgi:NAD(P)-dependent dehydrogenase (short-subunit alcohol dehydrogenase family)
MNILIIGASRGIGLEFCKQYLKNPKNKIFATRRKEKAEHKDLALHWLSGLEVANQDSWKEMVKELEAQSLDLIIYNAGIFKLETLKDLNTDSIEEQFYTNTFGAVLAIKHLLPKIKDGGKIAFLTSLMGSIADNDSGSYYGYRMSKAALNAFGKSLSIDLKDRKIAVALLHPGYVKTDMTSHQGHITPTESVSGLIKVVENLSLKDSGTFYRYDGGVLPW